MYGTDGEYRLFLKAVAISLHLVPSESSDLKPSFVTELLQFSFPTLFW